MARFNDQNTDLILFTRKNTDQVEPPGIVFEASLQENVSFEEVSPNLQRLAEQIARNLELDSLPSIAPVASVASNGKPGVRVRIPIPATHPILFASRKCIDYFQTSKHWKLMIHLTIYHFCTSHVFAY